VTPSQRHAMLAALLAIAPHSVGLLQAQQPGQADVVGVVKSFHEALGRADTAAVLAVLAPDVLIIENGNTETLAEYRAHHLPADIEFARAARTMRASTRVVLVGTTAWASATSTVTGSYKGRPVDSETAELMVLSRDAAGWRIRAIHWSSHPKDR
jgi:ketosteroid isomerase-like protein